MRAHHQRRHQGGSHDESEKWMDGREQHGMRRGMSSDDPHASLERLSQSCKSLPTLRPSLALAIRLKALNSVADPPPMTRQQFGPWMRAAFAWLKKFKGLRGGSLDFFGKTEERHQERQMIEEYICELDAICDALGPTNHAAAVAPRNRPHRHRSGCSSVHSHLSLGDLGNSTALQ